MTYRFLSAKVLNKNLIEHLIINLILQAILSVISSFLTLWIYTLLCIYILLCIHIYIYMYNNIYIHCYAYICIYIHYYILWIYTLLYIYIIYTLLYLMDIYVVAVQKFCIGYDMTYCVLISSLVSATIRMVSTHSDGGVCLSKDTFPGSDEVSTSDENRNTWQEEVWSVTSLLWLSFTWLAVTNCSDFLPHCNLMSVPLCILLVTWDSNAGCFAGRYIVDTVLLCVLFYHTVLSGQYHYPFRLSHSTVRQGVWQYGTLWTLYWCVCCITTQYFHVTSVPLCIPFVTQDSKTGCVALWYIVDTVLLCVLFYHTVLSHQYHYPFHLSHRTVRQGVWLYGTLWTLYCFGFVFYHTVLSRHVSTTIHSVCHIGQ